MSTRFDYLRRSADTDNELADPAPVRFRVPDFYREGERDETRGDFHWARLVTRVRPVRRGDEQASDYPGHDAPRGTVLDTTEGSVLMVVDERCTPGGVRLGWAVDIYVVSEDGTLRPEPPLAPGGFWAQDWRVRSTIERLLSDSGNAEAMARDEAQRRYGPEGSCVDRFVDDLRKLRPVDWRRVAVLTDELAAPANAYALSEEDVHRALDGALAVAKKPDVNRKREFDAARERVWEQVQRAAKRSIGWAPLDGSRSMVESLAAAEARLGRVQLAVEGTAVAAMLGRRLDEDTSSILCDAFLRLDDALTAA